MTPSSDFTLSYNRSKSVNFPAGRVGTTPSTTVVGIFLLPFTYPQSCIRAEIRGAGHMYDTPGYRSTELVGYDIVL